jgi:hypothetical protein
MGAVVAGDLLLALEGRLPIDRVRERCGRCMMRHAARREGAHGVLWWLWALLYDCGRWVSWRLQYRFRRPIAAPV